MAKLKRAASSATNKPDPTPKQSNPTLAIGLALFVAVALLTFVFTTSLQSKAKVFVAAQPIPAYTTVDPARMLKEVEVPKDSVGEYDLTPEKLEEEVKSGKALVTRTEVQQDQRVDQRVLDDSGTALAAVKDEERVIAVNTTFSGVVGGAVIPGAVVDIYSTGGGAAQASGDEVQSGAVAEDIKVLGVGTGGSAARALRTEASNANVKSGEDNGGDIVVLLSVPADQVAGIVAAGNVVMSLNPHLSFEPDGTLCEIGECSGSKPAAGGSATPQTGTETTPEETTTGTTEEDPAAEPQDGEEELPQSPVEEDPAATDEGR